jgi:hypothetical protein
MGNLLKVNEALAEWAMNVAKSVLPNVQIPPTSGIGGFMQMLGVDIRTYSIYDELGFLLKPTIKHYIEPMLGKFFDGKSDEEIKAFVMSVAEEMRNQARVKGYVNVFGIQLGESAFNGLIDILNQKLS